MAGGEVKTRWLKHDGAVMEPNVFLTSSYPSFYALSYQELRSLTVSVLSPEVCAVQGQGLGDAWKEVAFLWFLPCALSASLR